MRKEIPISLAVVCAALSVGAYIPLPAMNANTILGALVGGTPIALPVPGCSLNYSSGVGFGCNAVVPQGRLTLSSGVPIQKVDQVTVSSLWYAPSPGGFVPVNGSLVNFKASVTDTVGLELTLGSYVTAGNIYDIFVFLNAGLPQLCAGPAWTSSGAGVSTISTSGAIALNNGVFVNSSSALICKWGASAGTSAQIAAGAATELGRIIGAGTGTVTVQINPAASSGGTNTEMYMCNTYQKQYVNVKNQDVTATWSYASSTTRNANGSANNRINMVQCPNPLQVYNFYQSSGAPTGNTATAITNGIGWNVSASITGCGGAGCGLTQMASTGGGIGGFSTAFYNVYPAEGFNFAQSVEETTTVSYTIDGDDFMQQTMGLYY